jgi:hypothetical protein
MMTVLADPAEFCDDELEPLPEPLPTTGGFGEGLGAGVFAVDCAADGDELDGRSDGRPDDDRLECWAARRPPGWTAPLLAAGQPINASPHTTAKRA